jgi:hypothetical protein
MAFRADSEPLTRHWPHPRIDPDRHGIEDQVDAHPLVPRRLLGSGECLLDVALLLLEQKRLNLGRRRWLGRDLLTQRFSQIVSVVGVLEPPRVPMHMYAVVSWDPQG